MDGGEEMKPSGWLEGYKHTCPICGAEFKAMRCWQLKKTKRNKTTYFCSWKCMRKEEAEKKEEGERWGQGT